MTLQIGMIIGGNTPENEPTIERIRRMVAEAAAANRSIATDFDFDLTFQVSGPVWSPPFQGVRAGRLAGNRKYFPVEIGVPEAFVSDIERDRFLWSAVKQSVKKAEDALKRRRFNWSMSGMHEIVEEVLRRSLQTANADSLVRFDGTSQYATAASVGPGQDEIVGKLLVKLYSPTTTGWQYWEAWDAGGKVAVHTGIVGSRGELSELTVGRGEKPQDVIRHAMRGPLADGFEKLDEVDQASLIVQYPSDCFANVDQALRLWGKVRPLLNDELGWIGLGRCANVDYSGVLTFVIIAVDEALAVATLRDALDKAGYLNRAVVGVERSGQYIAVWPEDQKRVMLTY